MPDIYYPGNQILFNTSFATADGVMVDPTSPIVTLFDPVDATAPTALALTRVDIGEYTLLWSIPADTKPGIYRYKYSGVVPIKGIPTTVNDGPYYFQVLATGSGPSSAPPTYQQRIQDLARVPIGANQVMTTQQLTDCIQDALKEYSRAKPRKLTIDIVADGVSYEYALNTYVAGWNAVNRIISLERFQGAAQQTEHFMDVDLETRVYLHPDGRWRLKFLHVTPSGSETMRLTYADVHVLTASQDTLSTDYPQDFDAFCHLAASRVCAQASRRATDQNVPTVGATAVAFKTKGKDWHDRSRELFAEYERLIGSEDEAMGGEVVEWTSARYGNRPYFFHNPHLR